MNGKPSRSIKPERGLRQGDPLSPYLFVMCDGVFSGLLKVVAQIQKIHGIQVACKALCIFHLFFAYDNLLFTHANSSEAKCVMAILKTYQDSSGQLVNLEKSEVSCSKMCEMKIEI